MFFMPIPDLPVSLCQGLTHGFLKGDAQNSSIFPGVANKQCFVPVFKMYQHVSLLHILSGKGPCGAEAACFHVSQENKSPQSALRHINVSLKSEV